MNILSELNEIGSMLRDASMLAMVRQEVAKVKQDGFIVTDGRHYEGSDSFEVVVRCGENDSLITRRLKAAMPDAEISHIADGVIGLRKSRRG